MSGIMREAATEQGVGASEIARQFGMGRANVYRVLGQPTA
jgi:hypothetical protein